MTARKTRKGARAENSKTTPTERPYGGVMGGRGDTPRRARGKSLRETILENLSEGEKRRISAIRNGAISRS